MTIVTIEQSGSYQLSAMVPETEISQVKQGENATVQIQSINKSFIGKVSQVNQSSQFTGGQYIIKVGIPEKEKKGLYAGMYANLSIPIAKRVEADTDAVMVPLTCIVNKEQLTGVYTISAGHRALLRWVRLGKSYGDKVEVLSGLTKEEPFISSAEGKLYNGVHVKVK